MYSAPAKTATGFFIFYFKCLLFVLLGSFSFAWTNAGGGDHGGANWAPVNGATIGGDHTNVNIFTVSGTVYITAGIPLRVYAKNIVVSGNINGDFAGYDGGTGGGAGGGCAYQSNGGSCYTNGGGSGVFGGGAGSGASSSGAHIGSGGGGGGGYGGHGAPGGSSGGGNGGGSSGLVYGNAYSRAIELGSGSGGGGAGGSCFSSGGAGGSYGGSGSASGGGCTNSESPPAGSGGPGGGGNGRGGGAVVLNASTVSISGTITLNGGGGAGGGVGNAPSSFCEAGEGGGGGSGASGGGVLIVGDSITFTGTVTARGGPSGEGGRRVCDSQHYHSPGSAGGLGGGGRVKLFAVSSLSAAGSVDVSGYEPGTYKACLKICIEDNSSCNGGYMYDGECDNSPPVTTDSSDPFWHNADQSIRLACSDTGLSGCAQAQYCFAPCDINTGTMVAVSDSSPSITIPVCPSEPDCEKTITYRSMDNAGNWEAAHDTNIVKIDKTIPKLFSVLAVPDPFSPNGDGSKDSISLSYSTDSETGGTGYNATIVLYGISGSVRQLIKDKGVSAGAHSELWDGRDGIGSIVPDGLYAYNISITDRVGNANSTIGFVHVDLSGPKFGSYSPMGHIFELGDPVVFSANLTDVSGVDSAFACKSDGNCRDSPAGQYCRLERVVSYRDEFSCSSVLSAIGAYQYLVFANDSQNIYSSAGGSFRVRTVSVSVDAEPKVVDRQGLVRITAKYTENSTYLIAGATCAISGDVSGSMAFDGVQYYANNIPPPKLEGNSFTVTCSKLSYPTRSNSSRFIARDLSIALDYEYSPLAVNKPNFLYAKVKTISKYNDVQGANKASFNVTRDSDGLLVASGDFVWNPATGRWEANFTPQWEGNYTARAYFNATLDGGTFDGSSSISMVAGKGLRLSADSYGVADIALGSSAIFYISVENRRRSDVLYNVTLVGDLSSASFDGQDLLSSGRRYSTFGFVPVVFVQSHALLIKGMEVSPSVREVLVRFRENQPPYDVGEVNVSYRVLSVAGDLRFAPDIGLWQLFLIVFFAFVVLGRRSHKLL